MMTGDWKERNRPSRLEGRYEFNNYDALRDFLDYAAKLSESESYYPDMGFGRDYVNITIHIEDGESEIGIRHHQFAKQLDALACANTH